MANTITIYSKNNCIQCKMTKKLLDNEGATYQEINIDDRPEMVEYGKNLGFTAAPDIKSGDIIFSGFQPAKLKALL